MAEPRVDTTIPLPDGRQLAYAEFGSEEGTPILVFHGLPGSRLSWGHLPGELIPPDLRVIAPDRPGYGKSDPKPGRTLLDWANDVAALADELGLTQFSVLGVSGGGPGALACAWAMPQRVLRVGVVAGAAPTDAPGVFEGMSRVNTFFMKLAWRAPWLSNLNTRFLASIIRRNPGAYIHAMQRKVNAVDRAVLAVPAIRDMLIEDFTEALRQGGRGMGDDLAANHGQPWGFPLADLKAEAHLWYSELDHSIPPAMGQFLNQAIPGSKFTLVRDAGHLWVLQNLRDVLVALAPPTASPATESEE